jgi:hypothetical protein
MYGFSYKQPRGIIKSAQHPVLIMNPHFSSTPHCKIPSYQPAKLPLHHGLIEQEPRSAEDTHIIPDLALRL